MNVNRKKERRRAGRWRTRSWWSISIIWGSWPKSVREIEIGVAEWLNAQAPTSRQQVSVGTATVAMVLNGSGFSNRQLYLVPQFFEDKPIEHLLGPGITAADLNDDCLGRTLDWLYAHDITTLFAGRACGPGAPLGFPLTRLHADTTSFSVSGEYRALAEGELDAHPIAVTYGYSRDHREDLKQWMLASLPQTRGCRTSSSR